MDGQPADRRQLEGTANKTSHRFFEPLALCGSEIDCCTGFLSRFGPALREESSAHVVSAAREPSAGDLVHRLVAEGVIVRVAVRQPDGAQSALPAADLAQVTFVRADVRDQASVVAALEGADAVINAVSAYVEKGDVTFEAIVRGAETVAREAAEAGVARLVLISGIGADPQSRSPYIRSRGRGELAVQQVFPDATIVRPSAMFGPGDAMFGTLANLARLLPVLPLIGGGRSHAPAASLCRRRGGGGGPHTC